MLVDVPAAYSRGLRAEAALRGYQLSSGRAADLTAISLRELAPHVVVIPAQNIVATRELTAAANVPVIALAEPGAPPDHGAAGGDGIAMVDQDDELGTLFDLADRLSLGSSTAGLRSSCWMTTHLS